MELSTSLEPPNEALEKETDEPPSPALAHAFVMPTPANPASPAKHSANRLTAGKKISVARHLLSRSKTTTDEWPINPRTDAFRQRFYSQVSNGEWSDWAWQYRNRIRDLKTLAGMIRLSSEELAAFEQTTHKLPMSVTPYYMSLIDPDDASQALRRCVIPVYHELEVSEGEALDPLGEDNDAMTPGLVHRYPDRVLLLATGNCSVYCRYCTRHRIMGGGHGGCRYDRARLEKALAYIEAHTEVRDVLISGGDPLLLSDRQLDWLIGRVARIPHVEMVRLGTKVPAVLPQRVTRELAAMLGKHHPLFISIHFTHPGELTPETAMACNRLADAGIPLGSQTVLLAGVNDKVDTLKSLMHGLLRMRVRPYYLYQCDPILGSAHFRTPVSRGLEMIQGLRGHTTGYAVPTYVIDSPGGGGKIALYPESVVGREGHNLILRNFEGKLFSYPDDGAGWPDRLH